MKKIVSIFFIFLILFSLFSVSYAENINTELLDINANEDTLIQAVAQKNIFDFSDKDITISEPVLGDIFICCSQTVTINSTVSGNVFICANSLKIGENAILKSSLFSASKDITILGNIEQNVFIVSNNFTLENEANLMQDLFLLSQNANFNGSLGRDAYISCNELDFKNTSHINGNLYYSSEKEASIPDGTVSGNISFKMVDSSKENEITEFNKISNFAISNQINKILTFVILSIVVLFAIRLFSMNFMSKILSLKKDIGSYLLYGILALIITPIIFIILIFPIITLPIAILLLILYILLIVISSSIFVTSLSICLAQKYNEFLTKNDTLRQILFIVIISIIYKFLQLVPILGGILTFALLILGLGITIKCSINSVK